MKTAAAVSLLVISFSQGAAANAAPTLAPKGWECLAAPDNLNKPGRIFYIENGARFEMGDYSDGLPVNQSDIASGQWIEKGKTNVSLFAQILSLVSPVTGSAGVDFAKTYGTTVTLGQRKLLTTDEAPIIKVLRGIDPSLLLPNRKYFVIRNTQIANTVTITVEKGIAAAFGGDLNFKKAVQLSGARPAGATSSGTPSAATAAKPATSEASSATATVASAPSAAATKDKSEQTATGTGNGAPNVSLPPTPTNSIVSNASAKAYSIQANFTPPATVCILAQRFTSKTVFGGAAGAIRTPSLANEYWAPNRD